MSKPPPAFPRAPLFAAAALVAATLLAIAAVRISGTGPLRVPDAAALTTLELRFEDRDDGSVGVVDARLGRVIHEVAPGTNAFLRSSVRGLVRERKREGVGPELPFRLIGRADGRLTLEDPGTGRRIDLESFGPTNAAVFARLLAS